jgi:glycosyltransferase involved in cell wall biosynthesis
MNYPTRLTAFSVALCSYNGARFVGKQLASIAGQTHPPVEIVVCDDGSVDETVTIVENFARESAVPVRIEKHSSPLGVAANFSRAIELCSGPLIALSDQDDIWEPYKLERIASAFATADGPGLVFSDASAIDAAGNSLGYNLWDAIATPFTHSERRLVHQGRLFEVVLRHYVVTGATLAFHSRYRDLLLPIPPDALHDAWIATLIAAVAPCAIVEERLIRYRQHAAQVQGERPLGWLEQLQLARKAGAAKLELTANRFQAIHDRLAANGRYPVSVDTLNGLAEKVKHFRTRAAMIQSGRVRLPTVLGELIRGRYRRYSHPWKWPLADLFM